MAWLELMAAAVCADTLWPLPEAPAVAPPAAQPVASDKPSTRQGPGQKAPGTGDMHADIHSARRSRGGFETQPANVILALQPLPQAPAAVYITHGAPPLYMSACIWDGTGSKQESVGVYTDGCQRSGNRTEMCPSRMPSGMPML